MQTTCCYFGAPRLFPGDEIWRTEQIKQQNKRKLNKFCTRFRLNYFWCGEEVQPRNVQGRQLLRARCLALFTGCRPRLTILHLKQTQQRQNHRLCALVVVRALIIVICFGFTCRLKEATQILVWRNKQQHLKQQSLYSVCLLHRSALKPSSWYLDNPCRPHSRSRTKTRHNCKNSQLKPVYFSDSPPFNTIILVSVMIWPSG